MREVEAAIKPVESGSFGLFLGVSVMKTTGALEIALFWPDLYS